MSTKTTYQCDRCHTVADNTEDLFKVGITLVHHNFGARGNVFHQADWCRKCCYETKLIHILNSVEKEAQARLTVQEKQQEATITLETLLRNIIAEVVVESTSGG